MKKLSKDEMKKVIGGRLQPPDGGSGGPGCYKCCWTGTETCSECVYSYSSATCVTGASLSSCSGC